MTYVKDVDSLLNDLFKSNIGPDARSKIKYELESIAREEARLERKRAEIQDVIERGTVAYLPPISRGMRTTW